MVLAKMRLRSATILGAAALLSMAPAMTASAAPVAHTPRMDRSCGNGEACIWYYYYDAAHTQPAGDLVINCAGGTSSSGDTNTPYYRLKIIIC